MGCETLRVPQAHEDPTGPSIGIRVFRARGGPRGRAPVVYLQGGPGGSVRSFAESGFAETYARVFERDVLIVEQRGNALSSPALDCALNPASPPNEESFRACTERYAQQGVKLESINTIESAHDVDDVRRALGVDKVIVWGSSYGALLAATVARLHPGSVEALLLESPALTGRPYRAFDQFRHRKAKVEAFNAWLKASCATNPTCAERYPGLDPAAEMAELVLRSKTTPVVLADGVVIDSAETMERALVGALYYVPNAALLVRAVYHSNRDDLDRFDATTTIKGRNVRAYLGGAVTVDGIAYTTNFVINCYDLTRNWTDDGLRRALDGLFPPEEQVDVTPAYDDVRKTCAALPAPTVPQSELAIAVATAVPSLFIVGDLDHPTPVEDILVDLPRFSRSQLVRFPCIGHGVARGARDCFRSVSSAFFAGAEAGSFDAARPVDASCAAERCTSSDLAATSDLLIELQ